jgi:hypothetical protein
MWPNYKRLDGCKPIKHRAEDKTVNPELYNSR